MTATNWFVITGAPSSGKTTLLNLLGNAFDALADIPADRPNWTPNVRVETQRSIDSVLLRISDNGNGIPDDMADRIFEPFVTTKASRGGTGLGLSLSHDIVTEGHKGTLTYSTSESGGAAFTIRLPVG